MDATTRRDSWWGDIHYGWTAWFIVVHLVGIPGIELTTSIMWKTFWFNVGYFYACHISIACGAHRLYAHGTYEATTPLQYLYLIFFSGTIQGQVGWWGGKHRKHHPFADKVGDPHSPVVNSFFYSHMGWLCTWAGITITRLELRYLRYRKELRGSVEWHTRYYWPLAITMGIVVPTLVPLLWNEDLGNAGILNVTRLVAQYHLTWVVNSVGHRWGKRVEGGGHATNIWWLGLLTAGESYHGNHHQDQTDWRLGRSWYDLDLGKWFIWFCFQVRLARPRSA